MELVFFLLVVGVVGALAVLYVLNAREHQRVTLKGQGGGAGSSDSGDEDAGRFGTLAVATLSEGMRVNLDARGPRARVAAPAPATARKQTAKPAVKRTAVAMVAVTGKKKEPPAPVRRRTRP